MLKKQKNARKNKTSQSKKVELALKSRSKLRSFKLVHHRHTGKLLHRRHTSHLALVCILAVVGLFIYASQAITGAVLPPISHDVTVSAVVEGRPPTVGARITSPVNGASINFQPTFQISGTCEPYTMVVITSNNSIVGSTNCTSAGIFVLHVQLTPGVNILRARNYDGLNQPGPETPAVSVTVIGGAQLDQVVYPALPMLLASCDDYNAPVVSNDSAARVAVVCMPRSVNPDKKYVIGVLIWGGSSPYALDIDWGDRTDSTLLSLASSGFRKVEFQYAEPGMYNVSFKLKDNDGRAAFVQTSILVNGESPTLFSGLRDSFTRISWFETPIPLYLLAVALTLGFWAGDLFDRRFGITKSYKKTRHRTA